MIPGLESDPGSLISMSICSYMHVCYICLYMYVSLLYTYVYARHGMCMYRWLIKRKMDKYEFAYLYV
jgi:hypothetical protein